MKHYTLKKTFVRELRRLHRNAYVRRHVDAVLFDLDVPGSITKCIHRDWKVSNIRTTAASMVRDEVFYGFYHPHTDAYSRISFPERETRLHTFFNAFVYNLRVLVELNEMERTSASLVRLTSIPTAVRTRYSGSPVTRTRRKQIARDYWKYSLSRSILADLIKLTRNEQDNER